MLGVIDALMTPIANLFGGEIHEGGEGLIYFLKSVGGGGNYNHLSPSPGRFLDYKSSRFSSCVAENVIGKTEVIAILNINASPPRTALSLLMAAGCLAVSKYMAAHLSNSFI